MRQELVDLAMVGDRQSRQPSRKQLICKRRDSFRQRALLQALAFSSRRWVFAWRDQTGVHFAIASSVIVSGLPFTFTALLGFLSLSGMLMKNAIVLVEEIDPRRASGEADYDAIVQGSISRLRPVVLAAGTTIFGMLPLLPDAFFSSMAVTIMGGLAFASVLTLVAVPVLYAILFRIRQPRTSSNGPEPSGVVA